MFFEPHRQCQQPMGYMPGTSVIFLRSSRQMGACRSKAMFCSILASHQIRQTSRIVALPSFSRIRQHYRADAKGSTLRKTLGVLLEGESGFPLRRVGSGNRITLTDAGERWLNEWMEKNAFVTWAEHAEPWTIEHDLLRMLSCPFNIEGNGHHPFASVLRKMRTDALNRAREFPIAIEHKQKR
jgi:hypothetical protein